MKRNDFKLSSETEEQKVVVQWCDLRKIPIAHIPNEGKRSVAYAALLKAMGLRKGFPDLNVTVPSGVYHGMYIEMKYDKGKPSDDQKKWINILRSKGYAVAVCYDANEAIKTISDYLKGIRKSEWEETIGGK